MSSFPDQWRHPLAANLPQTGRDIEKRSFEIISAHLDGLALEGAERRIVERVVHATADLAFAELMRIHPDAVDKGIRAIREGRPIICDVRMLQAGITRTDNQVLCAIADPQVVEYATEHKSTRAAAAMEHFGERLDGAIVAVGNAPTAIWKLLELSERRGIQPALVVGLPVGFVGAQESKQALWDSGLICITNRGPRGGSPVAAAAVNALALMSLEKNPCN